MRRIRLSLKNISKKATRANNIQFVGWGAVFCGVGGIYFSGVIFVPFAFFLSIFAIFRRQFMLGSLGLLLTFIALLTSVELLFLIGKTLVFLFMGWAEYFNFMENPFDSPEVET